MSETYVSRASAQPLKEGKSRTPTDHPISQQGSKTKTAPGIGRGRFFKAGEAIRTPDIHVGNVTQSKSKPGSWRLQGIHHMHLMRLLCVDA